MREMGEREQQRDRETAEGGRGGIVFPIHFMYATVYCLVQGKSAQENASEILCERWSIKGLPHSSLLFVIHFFVVALCIVTLYLEKSVSEM